MVCFIRTFNEMSNCVRWQIYCIWKGKLCLFSTSFSSTQRGWYMLMTKNKLPTIMHASKALHTCPVCKGVHSNHRLYFHIFCKPAPIYGWIKRGMAHETETWSNCQLRQCWYEYKLGFCQRISHLYCFWATHFGCDCGTCRFFFLHLISPFFFVFSLVI